MSDDRAAREEKAIEQIREWLPELVVPGSTILIEAIDPATNDGAVLQVRRTSVFICRRGA